MTREAAEPGGPWSLTDRRFGYRLGCDGWATKKEAASRLACSTRTIERRIDDGGLRAIKLDDAEASTVRVCRRSIAEFIRRREITGEPKAAETSRPRAA